MPASLEFRLLGPIEAIRDGVPVDVGGARRRSVLAMLVLEAGRVVATARLVEGVWGEDAPGTATTALHGHISQLRRQLGDDVILTRAPGYVLDAWDAIDVRSFEAGVDAARRALAQGDPEVARDALGEALELWRGAPLADVADAPFAATASPALEELGTAAREERMEALLALGGDDELVSQLRAMVAADPLRERPRGQLMLALYRAGRQAEALEAFAAGRRALSEALGIAPGEALRQLHERILREDPALSLRAGPPGAPGTAGRAAAASGATDPEAAAPAASPSGRAGRRRGVALLAIAALALAAGVIVLVTSGRDGSQRRAGPTLRGSGLVRIDPARMEIAAVAPVAGTPTSLAAGPGRAWVINSDDQTVTEVSAAGKAVRTFSTGASPTDLAVAPDGLWLAEGTAGETQTLAPLTTRASHLAGPLLAVRSRVRLPTARDTATEVRGDRVAVSDHAAWVIAADGGLARLDPRDGKVDQMFDLDALSVAADDGQAWVLTGDGSVAPIGEDDTTVGIPVDVPSGTAAMAVGGGAVWLLVPELGQVTRLDPADPAASRTVDVGAGASAIAYGSGAAWVADGPRGRVVRLDANTGAVTGEVRVGSTPRDIAVSDDGVWVSATPRASPVASACVGERAVGDADVVLVAELPLRRGRRSPTDEMADAIGAVIERHGYRAGRHRVGFALCDDSTAQSANFDLDKCAANARGYAADPRVVIEVGPYNSGCAERQLPVAAAAPGGPLAMVSPTATDPLVTKTRDTGAFTRIVATDEQQAAAMAGELRRRGHTRVFVLDDADGNASYGLAVASYFAAAAREAGLEIAGRTTWRRGSLAALATRIARSEADAVYVSGALDRGAGAVVRALGPTGVQLAAPDLILPVSSLYAVAGDAARGMLLTTTLVPARGGRHPAVAYAEQATEVALDAIGRSDGSRRSVAEALRATALPQSPIGPIAFDARGDLRNARVAIHVVRRGGGSRELLSTEGAVLARVVEDDAHRRP